MKISLRDYIDSQDKSNKIIQSSDEKERLKSKMQSSRSIPKELPVSPKESENHPVVSNIAVHSRQGLRKSRTQYNTNFTSQISLNAKPNIYSKMFTPPVQQNGELKSSSYDGFREQSDAVTTKFVVERYK